MPQYIRPLTVHVVHHHETAALSPAGSETPITWFGEAIAAGLSGGDRSGKVPVRLWRSRGAASDFQCPPSIPLEHAEKNLVVIIVDQNMFAARDEWGEYITSLFLRFRPNRDLALPIACGAHAAKVAECLRNVNHINVVDAASFVHEGRALQAVYTSTLRHLLKDVPKVFLCHAKADGNLIVNEIRSYLEQFTQLRSFFDAHDIPYGCDFTRFILNAINESILLVLWTDRLLDSAWCQSEIIEARLRQRPVLVVDALNEQTARLFPFLGNMPVVRWRNNPAEIVTALLLELVRVFHLEALFESLKGSEEPRVTFGLHPPDLLAGQLERRNTTRQPGHGPEHSRCRSEFVYPDPPLKRDELQLLRRFIPGNHFLTLAEWHALRSANVLRDEWDDSTEVRPNPLRGMQIGISVSASESWPDLGLTAQHQDDLAAEIALNLILLGARVVWGGDLRADGLGNRLRQIVEAYQHPTRPSQDHVVLYRAFSPAAPTNPEELNAKRAFADVKVLDCPATLPKIRDSKIDADTIDGIALAALSYSAMRATMARECHARVLLGGQLNGFRGIYPGIVEEAYHSVALEKPIYILGGFGGAARAVFESIANTGSSDSMRLTTACQKFGSDTNRAVRDKHSCFVETDKLDYLAFAPAAVTAKFTELGSAGLSDRNGLSKSENEGLSKSQNLCEILGLLLKGLVVVARRR